MVVKIGLRWGIWCIQGAGGQPASREMMTMTKTHRTILTDSEAELQPLIGDDATATFENDPKFVDANPGATGSSENVEEQRDTDDTADSEEEILDEDDEDAELEEDDEEDEDEEVEAAAVAVANR